MERLYLYDTTLRDGQQTQGVQFSTTEKIQIAEKCSTNSASTILRAAGRVRTRPTVNFLRMRPKHAPK